MSADVRIRSAEAGDAKRIADLAEDSEMFPAAMLDDMIAPYLAGEGLARWYVAERDDQLLGFLYSDGEVLTDGTHNLKAMATAANSRAQGIGSMLIEKVEQDLARDGQRVMLVETSSTDAFASTRQFYLNRGFREEARISEFWAAGDAKVIYWKAIAGTG